MKNGAAPLHVMGDAQHELEKKCSIVTVTQKPISPSCVKSEYIHLRCFFLRQEEQQDKAMVQKFARIHHGRHVHSWTKVAESCEHLRMSHTLVSLAFCLV
jgi:hypothetical protein